MSSTQGSRIAGRSCNAVTWLLWVLVCIAFSALRFNMIALLLT